MLSALAGELLVPGVVAFVFLLVLTYLERQTREPQFHAWQLAWGFYLAHFFARAAFVGSGRRYWWLCATALLCLVLMAEFLLIAGRRMRSSVERLLTPFEGVVLGIGVVWAVLSAHSPTQQLTGVVPETGLAVVLGIAGFRYFVLGQSRGSLGYRVLAMALGFWAGFLLYRQLMAIFPNIDQSALVVGTVPQVLMGLSMAMVLFEYERRIVQENALALSVMEVKHDHLMTPEEVSPAVVRLLERILRYTKSSSGFIYVSEAWRSVLPSVEYNLPTELLTDLQAEEAAEPLAQLALRRGGMATLRHIGEGDIPGLSADVSGRVAKVFRRYGIKSLTAIALHSREHQLGIVVFPHQEKRSFGSAELRLLLALTMQVAATLDNYVIMHDALRRTREYEMLTQIGQVISSRLDPDEVLRSIHRELGLLFDTGTFYVAFADGDELRFEFETLDGQPQPKRAIKIANTIPEHIIRTGEPVLVRSGVHDRHEQLSATHQGRAAMSFVGVPVKMSGRTAGVICAMNFEREFVYEPRDLDVLRTAAGQLAVAMENALLYSEANQRAQYLSFLNNIANLAISSQGTDDMLAAIVGEIQKNFDFDHIGIGVIDYTSKDIEIKAEAGKTAKMLGRRIPIGVGIMGRVARTSETAVVQNTGDPHLLGVLSEARSVLCMPLRYGETLLGLLNVESTLEGAFSAQDVLLLNTLADLLSTALHNSIVFQRMEQQSITDALTGIKTRRFFLEALQSEWKRAARSGRSFSMILIDLDKFKEVNDTQGHLEGDLVLARVGRLLEMKCRQSNVVARYGGDEFVVLMPETGVEQAQVLAERLRVWLASDPMLNEREVTGSFGVASFPLHGATIEEIIRVADAGMYVSKHAGGNRVSTAEVASDFEQTNEHRHNLLNYIEGFSHREQLASHDAEEFVTSIRRFSEHLPQQQVAELVVEGLRGLAHVAELRENDSGSHGEDVATYAEAIARSCNMSESDIEELRLASQLHDVGKIFVPANVLNSLNMLTTSEYSLIMAHPVIGSRLASAIPGNRHIEDWIRHHHERMEGSGYPDQLSGETIPLGARIIAVADAYVVMTTERPFASAVSPAQALRELESSATLYDSRLVALLGEHVRGGRVTHTNA
jgi:diguanylate cyclase (GGDEF)-like protein